MRRRGPAPAPRVEPDRARPLVAVVDTSGAMEALALVQGDVAVAQLQLRRPRRAGATVARSLRLLLQSADRRAEDLAAIAIAVGPGAFTALRVGLSTVQGLAAGLGVPVVGFDSTESWAWTLPGRTVAVTLDARRNEVYTALWTVPVVGDATPVRTTRLESPESWAEALTAWPDAVAVGDGARLYADRLGVSVATASPAGPELAAIGARVAARAEAGTLERAVVRPLYLRDHDAAKPAGRA